MQLKNLILTRPLVCLDTETTGLLPGGRIVEIAMIKIAPDGYETVLSSRFNPGIPIPTAASRIHGITDEHVRQCPTFDRMFSEIAAFSADSDLCGFNLLAFDMPIIRAECERSNWWAGQLFRDRSLIDPMAIFHFHFWPGTYLPRGMGTLRAAVRRYLGRDHTGAHGAESDARAALAVLDAQLGYHEDMPRDVAALNQWPFTPAELFPLREPAQVTQGRLLEAEPTSTGPYGRGVGGTGRDSD